jgi:hypothetical protein
MAWKSYAVSAKTWKRLAQLDAKSFPWKRVINNGGTGSAVFELADESVAEVLGLYDLYPGQFLVVLEWDGTVVYAGFVEKHRYVRDTLTLTVEHKDIWSLWEDRKVISDRSPTVAKSKLTFSNLTLSTIAKRIIETVTTGPGFGVPIVFPADNPGLSSRTYYGYDLYSAAEALQELMDQDGGPDIDFHPRWKSDGTLEWQMRVAGTLTGPELHYDLTAEDSGARGMWIETDASQLVTHVYGVGEGTEVDMLVRLSQSSNIGEYPAREATAVYKDVKSGAQLQGLAQEAIRANNQATRQAGFEVLAGGEHKVSDIRLGSAVRWNVQRDPYITNGYRSWNLIQFSGGLGEWVTLEFQQKGG